jgi:hypothetical protein
MGTGRWSELSTEHLVRYTGNGRSFVTAMSKISAVAQALNWFVVEVFGSTIRPEFPSA